MTPGDAIEPPIDSPHYVRCENPQCPVRYAFEAEQDQPHWHFIGSEHHPAWDVP